MNIILSTKSIVYLNKKISNKKKEKIYSFLKKDK